MLFLVSLFAFLISLVSGAVINAPYSDYCKPNTIQMSPDHYCGQSAGCQPDPPGMASHALNPTDAAYPVAWLAWPAAPFPWGFGQTCFRLTGARNGPWPASYNLAATPVNVQLYDWAEHAAPFMGIMYDPYVQICNNTWNNSAVPPGWSTCHVWVYHSNSAQMIECPALSRLNNGNIIFDFNTWNNGWTVLVSFRNSRLGIESVRISDSARGNTTGVPFDTRTGGITFSISGQVRLPFTLYVVSLTGETLTQVISVGYPTANTWGNGANFGRLYSVNSNVQFTSNYDCGSTPSPTIIPVTPAPTTRQPTRSPTNNPTNSPTATPSLAPSNSPTRAPVSASPTNAPTRAPVSASPTNAPTQTPTNNPTNSPTRAPSNGPTNNPTQTPSNSPTRAPVSSSPTNAPTQAPSNNPTSNPTNSPTRAPSNGPTNNPTNNPTQSPTSTPTNFPTSSPTVSPTPFPTSTPSNAPVSPPSGSPTSPPTTVAPTSAPTNSPTNFPTPGPTSAPTPFPTSAPSNNPTQFPTPGPTSSPTPFPTSAPSNNPTQFPTNAPSKAPVNPPSGSPTNPPTSPAPTAQPTRFPTSFPTVSPTPFPTPFPTNNPTEAPINGGQPTQTNAPVQVTNTPTNAPVQVTNSPTRSPVSSPTRKCWDLQSVKDKLEQLNLLSVYNSQMNSWGVSISTISSFSIDNGMLKFTLGIQINNQSVNAITIACDVIHQHLDRDYEEVTKCRKFECRRVAKRADEQSDSISVGLGTETNGDSNSVPIWVYIVAAVAGCLLLLAIVLVIVVVLMKDKKKKYEWNKYENV